MHCSCALYLNNRESFAVVEEQEVVHEKCTIYHFAIHGIVVGHVEIDCVCRGTCAAAAVSVHLEFIAPSSRG